MSVFSLFLLISVAFKIQGRRIVYCAILASPVFAAFEHATPEEAAEFQQGLLVYVAEIAVILVERLAMWQFRTNLD